MAKTSLSKKREINKSGWVALCFKQRTKGKKNAFDILLFLFYLFIYLFYLKREDILIKRECSKNYKRFDKIENNNSWLRSMMLYFSFVYVYILYVFFLECFNFCADFYSRIGLGFWFVIYRKRDGSTILKK